MVEEGGITKTLRLLRRRFLPRTIEQAIRVFAVTFLLTLTVSGVFSGHPVPAAIAAESAAADVGTWAALSPVGAPSPRWNPLAVWTGNTLLIWGGYGSVGRFTNARGDGGRYNPTTRVWAAISTTDAPSPRGTPDATAVWTGTEMIVFGGGADLGGRYNPTTDRWSPLPSAGAPSPRSQQVAVWTGHEMLVWGGSGTTGALGDGARYDPGTNSWTPIATAGAPSPRFDASVVWTGTEMIVWGGRGSNGSYLGDGARYNPATNTWRPIATDGAPSPRELHSAVWDGRAMLIWGGTNGQRYLGDGARYDPTTDSWMAISGNGAPSSRAFQSAVWTGTHMLVWGGTAPSGQLLGDGASYDPSADSWAALPTGAAPSPRSGHAAVWTGSQMIIWGGANASTPLGDGAGYTPPSSSIPHDNRYFPQTGFRIDNDVIWDYFNRRGGVNTFGYPVSRTFLFQGFQVQFFQRRIVQLGPDGHARLLNVLDPGLLPYTSFNFATVPAFDPALVATAPAPTNAPAVLAWVQAHAPDRFNGMPVNFYQTFQNTVPFSVAFPNGGNSSLLAGIDLEMWGIPTSAPMPDPHNHDFVYLRFQRGIMMFDTRCACTQGMLLADYLKSILAGQNLPADLAQEAQNSPFSKQYDPGQPNWVHTPSLLPNTDLTNAFTPE
jgi:N-acetylneuraminic acid mutarotase